MNGEMCCVRDEERGCEREMGAYWLPCGKEREGSDWWCVMAMGIGVVEKGGFDLVICETQ